MVCLTIHADPSPSIDLLQEQKRVTQVTLAAVAVFIIVGTINLTGAVNRQQLWCGFALFLSLNRSKPCNFEAANWAGCCLAPHPLVAAS